MSCYLNHIDEREAIDRQKRVDVFIAHLYDTYKIPDNWQEPLNYFHNRGDIVLLSTYTDRGGTLLTMQLSGGHIHHIPLTLLDGGQPAPNYTTPEDHIAKLVKEIYQQYELGSVWREKLKALHDEGKIERLTVDGTGINLNAALRLRNGESYHIRLMRKSPEAIKRNQEPKKVERKLDVEFAYFREHILCNYYDISEDDLQHTISLLRTGLVNNMCIMDGLGLQLSLQDGGQVYYDVDLKSEFTEYFKHLPHEVGIFTNPLIIGDMYNHKQETPELIKKLLRGEVQPVVQMIISSRSSPLGMGTMPYIKLKALYPQLKAVSVTGIARRNVEQECLEIIVNGMSEKYSDFADMWIAAKSGYSTPTTDQTFSGGGLANAIASDLYAIENKELSSTNNLEEMITTLARKIRELNDMAEHLKFGFSHLKEFKGTVKTLLTEYEDYLIAKIKNDDHDADEAIMTDLEARLKKAQPEFARVKRTEGKVQGANIRKMVDDLESDLTKKACAAIVDEFLAIDAVKYAPLKERLKNVAAKSEAQLASFARTLNKEAIALKG